MSLLLDALKQAEKAKQEKAAEGERGGDSLSLETRPDEPMKPTPEPAPAPESPDTGELRMAPMEDDSPGAAEDREATGPRKRVDSGAFSAPDAAASARQERRELSLDLEKFADELANSTGRFQGKDDSAALELPPASALDGENMATMPSMKNVQESLREFYTGTSSGMPAPPPEGDVSQTLERDAMRAPGGTTQVSRREARNVFAAKSPPPKRRASTWMLLGVMLVLALLLGGLFLWSELNDVQPLSRPIAREVPVPDRRAPSPPAPRTAAVAEPDAPETLALATPPPEGPAEVPVEAARERVAAEEYLAATTPQPDPASGPVDSVPAEVTVPAAAPAESPAEASRPAAMAADAAPPPPEPAAVMERETTRTARTPPRSKSPAAPIQITRAPKVDPIYRQVGKAYRAFKRGQLTSAERDYRAVLNKEATNRDALLGLAAVAMKRKRPNEAQSYYLDVLALNPRDRVALAAMTALQTTRDPVQSESRIKILLSQEPDAGYLHFALGNVYASQSRWSEAQRAFFKAYSTDKANGDYLFNLAVSLDHLGQGKAALEFYRKALAAAARGSVSYDRSAVEKRVQSLAAQRGESA